MGIYSVEIILIFAQDLWIAKKIKIVAKEVPRTVLNFL
jgi:hypothetical protein